MQIRPAPAAFQRPALLSRPTGRALLHETSSRAHGCSPARSFPCLLPPGGTAALGLLPGASHPAVTSDARPGGNGSSDTNPGLPCCRQHRRPPLQEHPLNTRDLVSHLHVESALRLDRQNPSARFIVPGQEGTFAFPPQQPPYQSETARLGSQDYPGEGQLLHRRRFSEGAHGACERLGLFNVAQVPAVLQHDQLGPGDQGVEFLGPPRSANHVMPADYDQGGHG